MPPSVLHLEARVNQTPLGLSVIRDDDRGVPERGGDVVGDEHQVDLGSLALDPAHVPVDRLWHLDLVESDQREELDRAVGVGGRDLDGDVLEHWNKDGSAERLKPRLGKKGSMLKKGKCVEKKRKKKKK